MMRLNEVLAQAAKRLEQAGIESAKLDARLLLQHILQCDHAAIVRDGHSDVSPENRQTFDGLLARRESREPLSYIVGYRDFWKDRFVVSADVLDPRCDSETLIEAMLEHKIPHDTPYRIADFGCGSGCLLLSLLREYSASTGTGVDLSEKALAIAVQNAKALMLSARVNFLQNNWASALQNRFDMIISNPPYIADKEILTLEPEVKDFEPMMALSGGDDGLAAYRMLMPQIQRCLMPDGVAVLELGLGQADDVSQLAKSAGLSVVTIRADLAGVPRAMVINQA